MINQAQDYIWSFDFGSENCKTCLATTKQFRLIPSDFDYSFTPNYVNISNEGVKTGVLAKINLFSEKGTTFFNLKHLIGKNYEEVIKNKELYFNVEKGPYGELLIPASINGNEVLLTATQLLAMVFSSLKRLIVVVQ